VGFFSARALAALAYTGSNSIGSICDFAVQQIHKNAQQFEAMEYEPYDY